MQKQWRQRLRRRKMKTENNRGWQDMTNLLRSNVMWSLEMAESLRRQRHPSLYMCHSQLRRFHQALQLHQGLQPKLRVPAMLAETCGDTLQSVGLEVPVTPDVHARVNAPSGPRHSPREHVEEVEAAEARRARTEEHKKPRINKVEMHAMECEKAVRTVQFGVGEYHTIDEYDAEWKDDDGSGDLAEAWFGEDEFYLAGIPEAVWSDLELEGTASTTRLFHRPGGRWDWDQPLVRDEGLSQAWGLSRTSWRPFYNQVSAELEERNYMCVKANPVKDGCGETVRWPENMLQWREVTPSLLRQELTLRTYFLCCTSNDKQKDRVAVTTTSLCLQSLTSRTCNKLTPSRCISTTLPSSSSRTCQGSKAWSWYWRAFLEEKSAVYVLCQATMPGKMWWSNNFDARGWYFLCWDPRAFPQCFP